MLPSCNSKWTEHTPRTKLTLGQSFGLLFQQPGHRQGHHPSNTSDLCQLQHQGTEVASQQWPSQTPPAFKSSEQGKIPPGPCLRQLCSEQEEAGSSPAFSMLLPPGKAVNEEIWYTSLRCNFLNFFFYLSFSPVGCLDYGLSTTTVWYLHQPFESSGSEALRFEGRDMLICWMALLTTVNFY